MLHCAFPCTFICTCAVRCCSTICTCMRLADCSNTICMHSFRCCSTIFTCVDDDDDDDNCSNDEDRPEDIAVATNTMMTAASATMTICVGGHGGDRDCSHSHMLVLHMRIWCCCCSSRPNACEQLLCSAFLCSHFGLQPACAGGLRPSRPPVSAASFGRSSRCRWRPQLLRRLQPAPPASGGCRPRFRPWRRQPVPSRTPASGTTGAWWPARRTATSSSWGRSVYYYRYI